MMRSPAAPARPAVPAPGSGRGRRGRLRSPLALTYGALALAALFALVPVAWMVTASLRPNAEIFTIPPRWVPAQVTIEAYREIFRSSARLRYFLNSYVVGGATTVVSLALAVLAGYALSRFPRGGLRGVRLFMIVTQMVPPIALVIPYFVVIVSLRLYDTYPALIATYASFCLPFATLMLASYFDTIPRDLEEAAMVDGCTLPAALRRVVAPLAVPGLVATGVYAFLLAWNEFLFAVTLTQTNGMRTVPVGIALLLGEHNYEWNVLMGMSVLGSVPLFLAFVFVQRLVVSGLAGGAVKG
jgi:multiple sugar transport system permease protein